MLCIVLYYTYACVRHSMEMDSKFEIETEYLRVLELTRYVHMYSMQAYLCFYILLYTINGESSLG